MKNLEDLETVEAGDLAGLFSAERNDDFEPRVVVGEDGKPMFVALTEDQYNAIQGAIDEAFERGLEVPRGKTFQPPGP